jgi:hypothetical protein
LESSVKKSLQKYNRTKDEASKAGLLAFRDVVPKIHPLVREQLKTYKPKASGLEIGIMKTKDEGKIGMFREALQE